MSDWLIEHLARQRAQGWIHSTKGVAFVVLSAALIDILVVRSLRDVPAARGMLEEAQRIAYVGGWTYDLRSGRLTRPAEAHRIFGGEGLETSYEGFLSFDHPDDRKRMVAARDAAMAQEGPFAIDVRIIRPDGEVR